MSLSSCRAMSACSRALLRGTSHIADSCVLVHARLKILEDGRIDHARLRRHCNVRVMYELSRKASSQVKLVLFGANSSDENFSSLLATSRLDGMQGAFHGG